MTLDEVKKPEDEQTSGAPEEEVEGDETESEAGAEETEEQEEEAPAVEEAKPSDDVTDRLRAIEIENSFLRGQLARAPQAAKPEEPEDEDDGLPSEEEIDSAIRSPQAAKNLRGLFKQVVGAAEKRALKLTGKQLEQVSQASAAERGDADKALEMFPEVASNQQFREVRDGIVQALRMRNGGKYLRGDIVTATAAAYGECLRTGIIKLNGNGHAREEVRREIRKPGLTTEKPGLEGKKDPLAGYTPKERAVILQNCKEFKVTPEQWVKSAQEAEKDRA